MAGRSLESGASPDGAREGPGVEAPDWRERLTFPGWRALPWRELAVLGAIIVVSLGLRLATWNLLADGAFPRFVKTGLFGAGAAAAVWLLMRIQTGPRSAIPLLAAAGVLLSGDAVHYVRLANPISRGGPILAFTGTFSDEAATRRDWDLESSGGGRVAVEGGALVLESPPNGTAYATARLEADPDVRVSWWLPVGLAEREQDERLAWRAAIQRTGGYYVVTELRQLLVEVTAYGIHVTYPDAGGARRGTEVTSPVGSDGQPHDWLLERSGGAGGQLVLRVDGQQVWAAPQREPLRMVKLGETKVDPEHGGSMRVESVSYRNSLSRG